MAWKQASAEMLNESIETGEGPTLIPAGSVSWRVFKNPVAAFAGGVASVLLELAEPRVRTGVWEHTTFRTDPLSRMRRTGEAAIDILPREVRDRLNLGARYDLSERERALVCWLGRVADRLPAPRPTRSGSKRHAMGSARVA